MFPVGGRPGPTYKKKKEQNQMRAGKVRSQATPNSSETGQHMSTGGGSGGGGKTHLESNRTTRETSIQGKGGKQTRPRANVVGSSTEIRLRQSRYNASIDRAKRGGSEAVRFSLVSIYIPLTCTASVRKICLISSGLPLHSPDRATCAPRAKPPYHHQHHDRNHQQQQVYRSRTQTIRLVTADH